jgi:hypothetical protein
VIDEETKSFGDPIDSREEKIWKDTMVEEMEFLYNNDTWDLVKLPSGINHVH